MTPSRADLLADGGIYPVMIPLGWVFIDAEGQEEGIPAVPGAMVHRILAKGALMATERQSADEPEMVTVRKYNFQGPVNEAILNRYAEIVGAGLHRQGIASDLEVVGLMRCSLSEEPCGKLLVRHMAPNDRRVEYRYLLRDRQRQPWELVYLVRSSNLDAWRPLLAEIEASPHDARDK
jgi:hypothetical protein